MLSGGQYFPNEFQKFYEKPAQEYISDKLGVPPRTYYTSNDKNDHFIFMTTF